MPETRPPARVDMTPAEFQRWYWLKTELRAFAAQLGVSGAGSKEQISDRIVAALGGYPTGGGGKAGDAGHVGDGGGDGEAGQAGDAGQAGIVRRSTRQLQAPLSLDDVIPPGQRCTALVREFMVEQVGAEFRFDAHMRALLADPNGRTLADAVTLWRENRDAPPPPIGRQFEYNRFVRAYRKSHPSVSHQQVVAAWHAYRGTPADQRPPIDEM